MMNKSAFDTDIDYAIRMIETGCATVEQAARTCGIPLPILQAKLGAKLQSTPSTTKTARSTAKLRT